MLFGGSWEQLKGRFLLGSDDKKTLNKTGGKENHTLTIEEIPAHTHNVQLNWNNKTSKSMATGIAYKGGAKDPLISPTKDVGIPERNLEIVENSVGEGKPHDNMPPYLVVNIWKRTE